MAAMDRTPGQPQVKLSLLSSISLKSSTMHRLQLAYRERGMMPKKTTAKKAWASSSIMVYLT
jgi:hypothetical protein